MKRKKDIDEAAGPDDAPELDTEDGIEVEPDSDFDIAERPNPDIDAVGEADPLLSADAPEIVEASLDDHEAALARREGRKRKGSRPDTPMTGPAPSLPAIRGSQTAPAPARGPGWIYAVAMVASVLWVALLGAFFAGYIYDVEPLNLQPLALGVAGILTGGVLLIFWVLAFLAAQGAKLAAQARYVHSRADHLMEPALLAAGDTRGAVELVRVEIESAVSAAAQARHELVTLREVLASETARLVEAAASSARTATALTQALGEQRGALESLSALLSAQVGEVEATITRQARMVAEAADLAEVQIREAEATLTTRSADLAAAAGDAVEAARTAGEDLSRQAAKLEAAGSVVTDQVRSAEDILAEQRASIVQVAHQLRADQEDFAAQVESQQAAMGEVLHQMRHNAVELGANTGESSEALRRLIQATAAQFREVAEAAAEERDHVGADALRSIGALSESARREREALTAEAQDSIDALARAAAEAKASTESQAESARLRIEQLSEAAFSAGQKADTAFEARLNEARAIIEQSVELVEEAGKRAGARLVEGLDAAKSTVDQLERLLADLEVRTSQLPADAEARSAEVKATMEQGVEQLLDAARRAADETQAIDAAFQERVRRNYEMLSEAVRLMGVVGGAPSPRPPRSPRQFEPPPVAPAPAPAPSAPSPPLDEPPERPRLRLRPAPSDEGLDEEIYADPPPPEPAARPDGEGWTWRELLSSIDDAPAPTPGRRGLLGEIRDLGIDSAALLPQARTAEIATVLQAGDQVGAREIVRTCAPAAMRRLSRRILTDDALRAEARDFAAACEARIDAASSDDLTGQQLAQLLGSDEGRAYLLIDAAVGDLS